MMALDWLSDDLISHVLELLDFKSHGETLLVSKRFLRVTTAVAMRNVVVVFYDGQWICRPCSNWRLDSIHCFKDWDSSLSWHPFDVQAVSKIRSMRLYLPQSAAADDVLPNVFPNLRSLHVTGNTPSCCISTTSKILSKSPSLVSVSFDFTLQLSNTSVESVIRSLDARNLVELSLQSVQLSRDLLRSILMNCIRCEHLALDNVVLDQPIKVEDLLLSPFASTLQSLVLEDSRKHPFIECTTFPHVNGVLAFSNLKKLLVSFRRSPRGASFARFCEQLCKLCPVLECWVMSSPLFLRRIMLKSLPIKHLSVRSFYYLGLYQNRYPPGLKLRTSLLEMFPKLQVLPSNRAVTARDFFRNPVGVDARKFVDFFDNRTDAVRNPLSFSNHLGAEPSGFSINAFGTDEKEYPLHFRSPVAVDVWGRYPLDFVDVEWPPLHFRNPVAVRDDDFVRNLPVEGPKMLPTLFINPVAEDARTDVAVDHCLLNPLSELTTTDLWSLRTPADVDPKTFPHFSRSNVGVDDERSTRAGVNAAFQTIFVRKDASSNPDLLRSPIGGDSNIDANLPRNAESVSGGRNDSSLFKNPVGNSRSDPHVFGNTASKDRGCDWFPSQNPLGNDARDPNFVRNTWGKNSRSNPDLFKNSTSMSGKSDLDLFMESNKGANPELEVIPHVSRNPRARRVDQDFSENPFDARRDPEHGSLPQKRSIADESDPTTAKRMKF
eukprot:TRINITY_DN18492_c0_g5_i1.p1 TRINITY_DN18492_c0_g5~~TRINITY_DN18492_c0_g5_i1.p1  ORF type:complete len:718 (+),score=124.72 TRINITY_DN18492_c0_g5_i1:3-2156(+)